MKKNCNIFPFILMSVLSCSYVRNKIIQINKHINICQFSVFEIKL